MDLNKETNQYLASMEGFRITGMGSSPDKAVIDFFKEYIQFANDIFNNRVLQNATNIRPHLEQLRHALVINDSEALKEEAE